ncbi:MAG: ATP-binding cassette domain-containing protein, partial [Magnetococcales bacterium]|nr:ATP-binding cassette domain-containing protein [Magnetococcales bacterium]
TRAAIVSPEAGNALPVVRPVRGAVRYAGVVFGYGQGLVLPRLDLEIAAGERVAVVGPTGAGKSSLIRLLNRTYDPERGEISIDGVPIKRMPLPELRRLVGVVPQETTLFAGTIAENITLNDPGVTRRAMEEAAARTGADRMIAAHPGGFDFRLTERGGNLSSGERQLLGFTRVLAFDPRILVMDEATSAVDAMTERHLQAALAVLLNGRTALIVAHRLSTVLIADRILVLSRGRIVESGDHRTLLAAGGLYARLHALQLERPPSPGQAPGENGTARDRTSRP